MRTKPTLPRPQRATLHIDHEQSRAREERVRSQTVAIVGLGYVGLPLAVLARKKGLRVRGFDIDTEKIAMINTGEVPYLTPDEQESLTKLHLHASADTSVLAGADTYVICVPTPVHHDHEPDLGPLESACRMVAPHLTRDSLVIVESTVNPGVSESIALKILEDGSGLTAGKDFSFAYCPERINPGDEKWNVRTIPRVLGGLDERSLERAKAFYEEVIEGPIFAMGSIKEAEAVKMVENAFRDVNIAFVNELAMSFSKAGIDLTNVLDGAATKPFGFVAFTPGCGVGGHCIPVDPYYLIRYGRENGFEHRFLVAAREINNQMPLHTVDLAEEALESKGIAIAGARVTLLGLAYKRDISDLRESPALDIANELERRGAIVTTYDPYVLERSTVASTDDALSGADAVVIATDHAHFCDLTAAQFSSHDVRVVVDGRNCLDKASIEAAGIAYRGIGR